jgi:hypothetical protein
VPVAAESTLNVPVIEPGQLRTVTTQSVYDGTYDGLPLFAPRAVAIGPTANA